MSKYVRTNDGIYELNPNNYVVELGFDDFVTINAVHKGILGIKSDSILQQADTIKELCDGFCLEVESEHYHNCLTNLLNNIFVNYKAFMRNYNNWFERLKYGEVTKLSGYGFIKTDKGLIYVCKVEDGGLRLI